jgi:RNA polymerase sigma-70 factor (ECF subfamily)
MAVPADRYPDERELICAARGGCAQSFQYLTNQYYARILTFLTAQTGDPELAADLAQDTFLEAFRDLRHLPDDRPFTAWLFRIARNNVIDASRRRKSRQSVSLEWLRDEGAVEWPAMRTTDETTACHERILIQELLDELSPALREALLYSVASVPGEEIAHILGISAATARQRISRAKAEFRLRYAALNGSEHPPCARRLRLGRSSSQRWRWPALNSWITWTGYRYTT